MAVLSEVYTAWVFILCVGGLFVCDEVLSYCAVRCVCLSVVFISFVRCLLGGCCVLGKVFIV